MTAAPATPRFAALRRLPRLLAALGILALGGVLLAPPAQLLRQEEQQAGLLLPEPSAEARDALTQQFFLFSLGGLRSLSAEILALDATTAWVERDWERAQRRWMTITRLCPHRLNYWERAARDMHTNAAADAASDRRLSAGERYIKAEHYRRQGERFLLDALDFNPDNPRLYALLGDMYGSIYRKPQFGKAVDAYREALRCGAPAEWYERQLFFCLCRIRGREQEAWELGRRLFDTPGQRVPSLRCLLFSLEHKLNIPESERLSPVQLFGSVEEAREELSGYLTNDLLFPTDGVAEYLKASAPQPSSSSQPERG